MGRRFQLSSARGGIPQPRVSEHSLRRPSFSFLVDSSGAFSPTSSHARMSSRSHCWAERIYGIGFSCLVISSDFKRLIERDPLKSVDILMYFLEASLLSDLAVSAPVRHCTKRRF